MFQLPHPLLVVGVIVGHSDGAARVFWQAGGGGWGDCLWQLYAHSGPGRSITFKYFSIEGHFVQPHVAILFTLSDFWRHFTKIRIKIMVLTGLPE
jgi:hypothetical protein